MSCQCRGVYCHHRSPTLNKLYIEMAKPVAVRFSLGASRGEQERMLVRALPVYQDISRCKYFSRVEQIFSTSFYYLQPGPGCEPVPDTRECRGPE